MHYRGVESRIVTERFALWCDQTVPRSWVNQGADIDKVQGVRQCRADPTQANTKDFRQGVQGENQEEEETQTETKPTALRRVEVVVKQLTSEFAQVARIHGAARLVRTPVSNLPETCPCPRPHAQQAMARLPDRLEPALHIRMEPTPVFGEVWRDLK